jgi:hypothetical protein
VASNPTEVDDVIHAIARLFVPLPLPRLPEVTVC